MCRRNQLLGCAVLVFGVGLLVGMWIDGGFFAHCIGFGLIIAGCYLWKKK